MLNEIILAADYLEAMGVLERGLHPAFRAYNKGTCLRLDIAEDGAPMALSALENPNELPGRKFAPNNHASIPAVNLGTILNEPLPEPDLDAFPKNERKPLLAAAYREALILSTGDAAAWKRSLNALSPIANAAKLLPPDSIYGQLAKSILLGGVDRIGDFIAAHVAEVIKSLPEGAIDSFAKSVFEVKGASIKLGLLFVPANNPLAVLTGSGAADLDNHLVSTSAEAEQFTDAFGGVGAASTPPALTLPKVHPMAAPSISRATDFRALHRYGGNDLIPVSDVTSRRIKSTWDFLLAPEKEGITWASVAGNGDATNIAVVVGGGEASAAMLDMLCKAPSEKVGFETAARHLLEGAAPNESLTLLVISSPSKMCIRLESASTLTPHAWGELINSWQRDLTPLSHADLPLPTVPATPGRLAVWSGSAWKLRKDAPEAVPVHPLSVSAEALLSMDARLAFRAAKHFRALMSPAVISYYGQCRYVAGLKLPHKTRLAISEYCAFLHLIERRLNPHTMNESHPSYLLGRYLALADALQAAFRQSRNLSKSRSTLCGAANLTVAKTNPVLAMSRANSALAPALKWLSSLRNTPAEEKPNQARIFGLGATKKLRAVFGDHPPVFTTDLTHQNMLTLGYLADPFPKSEVPTEPTEK